MKRLSNTRLSDPAADAVRQEHATAIGELQSSPLLAARVIPDVSLLSGIETPVPHGLGRAPVFLSVSPPRGASTSGRIEEIRTTGGALDRKKFVTLLATGWGATIYVDVTVG